MKLLLLLFATTLAVPPDIFRALPLDCKDSVNRTDILTELVNRWIYETSLLDVVMKLGGVTEDSRACLSSLAGLLQSSFCLSNCSSGQMMQIVDSWPKLPAGILRRGPFFLLGDYDQCLDIQKTETDVHYCTLGASVGIRRTVPLTGGFCLPHTCSEPAIQSLVTTWLTEVVPTEVTSLVELKDVHCRRAETGVNRRRVLFYTILGLWAFLLFSGTYVDYKLRATVSDSNANVSFDVRPVAGSDEDGSEVVSKEKKPPLHLFNSPSIALTFRSVPDLKKQLVLRNTLVDVLCAFSIRVSLTHLFRNSARELSVLHGIKVFSAFWIILGHCCLFSLPYMDTVLSLSSDAVNPWLSSILFNSSLAVDSFLFVTGTVLAYTVRKRMLFRGPRDSSPTTLVHLLLFYTHRLSRLWPSLLLFVVFMSCFYSHLGDGPLWNSRDGIFGSQCTPFDLARLLLFVSNFSPSLCLPWLWHISLDFQLYLIAPLFLFFLSKRDKRLLLGAGLLIAMSLVYRLAVFLVYRLPPNMFLGMIKEGRFEEGQIHFKLLYGSPLSRCPPFIVGLLTGWFMCIQQKKKYSWLVVGGLKLTAYGLLGYALFAPMSQEGLASILHAVLHRLLWSLGLSVLVWLSESGHHSLCHFILASPRLLPVSRLSFGLYLCHEPILLYLVWSQRQATSTANFGHFLVLATTVTALSLLGAFVFAICFELPCLNIERRLFKRTDTRFNREKQNHPTNRRHVEKMLGKKATAMMSFQEKTELWLSNVENPYGELVEGGVIREEEEEDQKELESITTMSEELLLEEEALLRE